MRLNMFEEILEDSTERKKDHLKLRKNLIEPSFEKSIDNIIDQINLDSVIILKYNRI